MGACEPRCDARDDAGSPTRSEWPCNLRRLQHGLGARRRSGAWLRSECRAGRDQLPRQSGRRGSGRSDGPTPERRHDPAWRPHRGGRWRYHTGWSRYGYRHHPGSARSTRRWRPFPGCAARSPRISHSRPGGVSPAGAATARGCRPRGARTPAAGLVPGGRGAACPRPRCARRDVSPCAWRRSLWRCGAGGASRSSCGRRGCYRDLPGGAPAGGAGGGSRSFGVVRGSRGGSPQLPAGSPSSARAGQPDTGAARPPERSSPAGADPAGGARGARAGHPGDARRAAPGLVRGG